MIASYRKRASGTLPCYDPCPEVVELPPVAVDEEQADAHEEVVQDDEPWAAADCVVHELLHEVPAHLVDDGVERLLPVAALEPGEVMDWVPTGEAQIGCVPVADEEFDLSERR